MLIISKNENNLKCFVVFQSKKMLYNEKNGKKGVNKMIDIKTLSIDDKLKLLTGKNGWQTNDLNGKIPSVFMADGPHGLRKIEFEKSEKNTQNLGIVGVSYTRYATAMPNLSVLSNTWNEDLAYLDGATIADECIDADVDMLLAPGVNIKRNVLNGRNFEYFSEDPFIAGKMARAYIEGVQDKGVGTSLKHFLGNNSEHDRNSTSSEIDERTMREIYTPAFEEALKAKPWTVMCSYNPVNGVYASQNKKILDGLLRKKFGFDGLIVSDWRAVHNHPEAVKATLDLRMPYEESAYEELKTAYEKGELSEQEIDLCITNLLKLIDKKVESDKTKKVTTTEEQRHQNAVEIAKEGIVLLKNEDNVLPLKKANGIAFCGMFNEVPPLGGGGSSLVVTKYRQTALSTLIEQKTGIPVTYNIVTQNQILTGIKYFKPFLKNAYSADVAIISVGEREPFVSEDHDREKIKLTAVQENLIINTCKYNKNVIVLVYGGSAIDMSAWIDKVKAVVFVGYAGEGVNQALSSILTGEVSPSGKLTETFPLCVEDTVTEGKFDDGLVDWYKEGVFVGYRYYDKYQKEVLYPFGHGLSYANFEYSNLEIVKNGKYEYTVSYDITNISNCDAKEVSQVYVKEVFPVVVRPERELKGYSKDLIKAGETKRVSVKLDKRSFAYYSVVYDDWTVESGAFEIHVGASSRDIKLIGKIKID